jgi:hypothetical protein
VTPQSLLYQSATSPAHSLFTHVLCPYGTHFPKRRLIDIIDDLIKSTNDVSGWINRNCYQHAVEKSLGDSTHCFGAHTQTAILTAFRDIDKLVQKDNPMKDKEKPEASKEKCDKEHRDWTSWFFEISCILGVALATKGILMMTLGLLVVDMCFHPLRLPFYPARIYNALKSPDEPKKQLTESEYDRINRMLDEKIAEIDSK